MSRKRNLVWRVVIKYGDMNHSPYVIEEQFFSDRRRAYLEYQKKCIKYFYDDDYLVYIEPVEVF